MKVLGNFLLKSSSIIGKIGHYLSSSNKFLAEWKKWVSDNKIHEYRTAYDELNPDSIIFDLGGYEGQWASDIYAMYLSNVYVFEPHPNFANKIEQRFKKNPKIKIFDFGIGSQDETLMLSSENAASSTFKEKKSMMKVSIKSAEAFFVENNINQIDLMKINIEGGEYDLLNYLIDSGRINSIINLQIQFHDFVPNAEEMMQELQGKLEMTHVPTYRYEFIWENWKLRE
ncbi:MAG: FkbM family methyltransferase [Cyclobacteriaceae bacterium]